MLPKTIKKSVCMILSRLFFKKKKKKCLSKQYCLALEASSHKIGAVFIQCIMRKKYKYKIYFTLLFRINPDLQLCYIHCVILNFSIYSYCYRQSLENFLTGNHTIIEAFIFVTILMKFSKQVKKTVKG